MDKLKLLEDMFEEQSCDDILCYAKTTADFINEGRFDKMGIMLKNQRDGIMPKGSLAPSDVAVKVAADARAAARDSINKEKNKSYTGGVEFEFGNGFVFTLGNPKEVKPSRLNLAIKAIKDSFTKIKLKDFWNNNKKSIIIGSIATIIVTGAITYFAINNNKKAKVEKIMLGYISKTEMMFIKMKFENDKEIANILADIGNANDTNDIEKLNSKLDSRIRIVLNDTDLCDRYFEARNAVSMIM